MEARKTQSDASKLTQPTSAVAQASAPAAKKVVLDIDLDKTVALELTEAEKKRYRSTRAFADRRTFVESLKDDTDAEPVKVKKTKKQKQRELFAAKEGDYTNPVVILILLDIQDKLNEHVANLAKTDPVKAAEFDETIEIIKATLEIFVKSDQIMQGWSIGKPIYLSELKNRAKDKSEKSGQPVDMFQHLNQLVNLVDKVKVPLSLVKLIRELGLWLFGMYWNDAALLIPEGKLNEETDEPIKEIIEVNGKKVSVFPLVSKKDRAICYGQFGFRMLDVTYNHFLVYKKLEEKCIACELANGIVREAPPVVAVPVKVVKKADDFSVRFVDSSKQGMTDLVVRINTANFPDKSVATAKRALIAMFKNPLGALLSYRLTAPLELRIREFSDRLTMFELSEEMRGMLAGTKNSALEVLKGYKQKKSTFLNNARWAVSLGMSSNPNFKLVEDAHNAIMATNKYEDIIAAMVTLREGAVRNESTNIAADTTRFLLNQIDIIRNSEAATGPGIVFPEPTVLSEAKDPDFHKLVFNIPDEHCEIAETICKTFHSIVANQIGFALAQCNLSDDDQRIQYFKKKIIDCGFTVVQEEEYAEFYARTKDVVLEYIDPENLRYVNLAHYFQRGTFPRFFEQYLEKTHAVDADGLLRVLTDTQIPLANKILSTIEIYEKLSAPPLNSTTLGPALKKFLVGYMSWLTPYIPKEKFVPELRSNSRSGLGMK